MPAARVGYNNRPVQCTRVKNASCVELTGKVDDSQGAQHDSFVEGKGGKNRARNVLEPATYSGVCRWDVLPTERTRYARV